jgi:hypothetical protein
MSEQRNALKERTMSFAVNVFEADRRVSYGRRRRIIPAVGESCTQWAPTIALHATLGRAPNSSPDSVLSSKNLTRARFGSKSSSEGAS